MIIQDDQFQGFAAGKPTDEDAPGGGSGTTTPEYTYVDQSEWKPYPTTSAPPLVTAPADVSTGKSWWETLIDIGGGLGKKLLEPDRPVYQPLPKPATPSWVLPVALGGGALVLVTGAVLLTRKSPAMAGYRRLKRGRR